MKYDIDLCSQVEDYINNLDPNIKKRVLSIIDRLSRSGQNLLKTKWAKYFNKDGIYELRIFDHRILYNFKDGNYILLHAFKKKGGSIRHHIDTAKKRFERWILNDAC